MSTLPQLPATDALNLPLDGLRLIEASAGTGKTYTIAGLYARLIVERRLSVRQVLVMTFTRAATEELRQRLRERLVVCADMAAHEYGDRGPSLPEVLDDTQAWAVALLRRAHARGEETDAELVARLRQVATGMDEAAIFTLHGFCQRVLTAHAALLEDVTPGAEPVANDRDLLNDFAADAWLRVAGSGDADELAALRRLAATPEALAGMLARLVGFDGVLEPAPGKLPPEVDAEAEWRPLFAAWREDGAAAVATFEAWYAAGHLSKVKYPARTEARLRQLAELLGAQRRPDADALARFAGSRLAVANNKGKPAFPEHAAFAAIDDWLAAHQAIEARRQAWLPVLLHRIVAEARDWLAQRKRDLARLTYDDLITRLADGVAGDSTRSRELVAALRGQYPCALVDEFQDTDTRQFGILDKLYGDFGTLYMIGDPKQAIYGFRGGDVHAYLRAAKQAAKCPPLNRNFRSSPGLLQALDAVFRATEHPFLVEGIEFEPVQPGGNVVDGALTRAGDAVKPMTFWTPLRDEKGKPLKGDALRQAMAGAAASTIAMLLREGTLDGKSVQPASIAVLTGTNDEAALMQDRLQACGVPAVCLRHESIFASCEARELLRVLDALLVPQSMPRARAALATELLGRTLDSLARMQTDEALWRAALDELADLRDCWFARGIQAMLERLAEYHAPRLLALPDGERRLSNVLQLGDALAADGHRLAGERTLRDALAQHIRDADRHNESEQLRLESDAKRVQIVTLHRSKGLQYDVVLMPFVGAMASRTPSKGTFATFHRGDARVKQWIVTGSKERSSEDAHACDEAQHESLAEGVRTLYVGLTRARHACWVGGGGEVLAQLIGNGGDASDLATAHAAVIAAAKPPDTPARSVPAAAPPALAEARRFTRDLPRDWWVHSFSQLAAGARDDVAVAGLAADETAVAEDASEPSADGDRDVPAWPRGARYGNAVHAILEKTDFVTWREADSATPPPAEFLIARELRAAGYGGNEHDVAHAATARLVAAALRVPIVGDLRLADLPATDRRAELPFHFGINGADPAALLASLHSHGYQRRRADYKHLGAQLRGLMTGVIDLVFRHGGQWWLVDYKTNYLGPRVADYAAERLPAAIAAHDYDLQSLIYTVALHRWLCLTLGAGYEYARDFGGVRYLFVRGMAAGTDGQGVFVDKPPRELIDDLDAQLEAPGEKAA